MSSNDAIARLRVAVSALGDVDVSGWDDAALTDHLAELSTALCEVDSQLSRVAEAIRARGFRISEPAMAQAAAA
jgi:DNA-binding winged helix-turn-helix (wHTH) protein